MEYAKKMVLVDPRLMDSLQKPQSHTSTIVEGALNKLDMDMKEILNRPDLSEGDKVTMYNQVLQRYLTYQNKIEPPKVHLLNAEKLSAPAPTPIAGQEDEHIEEEIVEAAPKVMRKKAHLLLKRLRRDPQIDWNGKGELVYKGKTVKNSHINDLVQDVLRKRKQHNPHGWETFADALKQNNVPKDLVGNVERWNYMHHKVPQAKIAASPKPTLIGNESRPAQSWISL